MWKWIKLIWDTIRDFFRRYKEIQQEEEIEKQEEVKKREEEIDEQIETASESELVDIAIDSGLVQRPDGASGADGPESSYKP